MAFAELGAEVFACDVWTRRAGRDRGAAAASAATRARLDVTDRDAVQALVAETESAKRRRRRSWSTMPAACAARSGRPLEEIEPADWQAIFDVNLSGAFC